MNSIGETLRDARHEKKASLEDVSRATKVKIDILEKLEADNFAGLVSPTYAKGFLKLYADYLGLDSAALVENYVKSQGGLRRQGLQVETAAAVRARRPGELRLPVRRVAAAVAGMTLLVIMILVGYALWERWHHQKVEPSPETVVAPTLPKTEFEAYYTPKKVSAPELLDVTGK